jgi:hypothetical protein
MERKKMDYYLIRVYVRTRQPLEYIRNVCRFMINGHSSIVILE